MGEDVLTMVSKDALVMELASAPYGVDIEAAKRIGVHVEIESGIPGRYAPLDAGAALFDALARAMMRTENGQKGGNADG